MAVDTHIMGSIHIGNPDQFRGYAGIHDGLELQQHLLSLPREDLDQLANLLRAIAKCKSSSDTIAGPSSPAQEVASALSPSQQDSESVTVDRYSTPLTLNPLSSKSSVREKKNSSRSPVPIAESPLRDTTSHSVVAKQSKPVWKGSVQLSPTQEDDGTFAACAEGISPYATGNTDSSTLVGGIKNPITDSNELLNTNKSKYHHTPGLSLETQTIPAQGQKQEKFVGLIEALSKFKRSIPGTSVSSSKLTSMARSIFPNSEPGRGFFSPITRGPETFVVEEEDSNGGFVYISDFESSLLPETPPGCDSLAAPAESTSPGAKHCEKDKSAGRRGELKVVQGPKGVKRSTPGEYRVDKAAARQVAKQAQYVAQAGFSRLQDAVDTFVLPPGADDWDYRVRNPLCSYENPSKPITQQERARHIANGYGPTYAEFLRMDPEK
ncbi:uncharacterized protein BDZ99DRAFT_552014 [Mytilinidion resinicola]|uniref:Uncharacterized protein n=1 Tax=Mytilinidion resinicola TaxID=574789 RepID=A0A6A6Y0I2_9PEZI|nr:uncharacterized protein BDZ99DRAFT_552014 [Mytilinidion resinicola]KAF2802159.1 hypothetical protein BDZ99DRAFT_552014 [Mytilinidion resinicola]